MRKNYIGRLSPFDRLLGQDETTRLGRKRSVFPSDSGLKGRYLFQVPTPYPPPGYPVRRRVNEPNLITHGIFPRLRRTKSLDPVRVESLGPSFGSPLV